MSKIAIAPNYLLKQVGKLNLDKNKKTILFIEQGDINKHSNTQGSARILRDKLSKQYNIVTVGIGAKLKSNYFNIYRDYTLPAMGHIKRSDVPNHIELNNKHLFKAFSILKDIGDIEYVILSTLDVFRLPMRAYVSKNNKKLYDRKNEFFDSIYESELAEIRKVCNDVHQKWDKVISPYAISTRLVGINFKMLKYLNSQKQIKKGVIALCIDPVFYTPFFSDNNIPLKTYYFANDNRGTRNMLESDIAQLQHLVYDLLYINPMKQMLNEDNANVNNMIFAGTIFHEKGNRVDAWTNYLKDIKSDLCDYFIPFRNNGAPRLQNILESDINNVKERFDIYSSVAKHDNVKDFKKPIDLLEILPTYKYGLILSCVSIHNSLNFRPVLYAKNYIMPLIDPMYDPDYLQIPKEIQDKITVNDSADIDRLIQYYNNNEDERMEIINSIRQLLKINEYEANPELMINKAVNRIIPGYIYE